MQEILSIGVYLPFAVLPEGVKQDIISDVSEVFLFKDFTFTDENTELYFLKAQGSCCDYEVITTAESEDEPPKTKIVYLGGLCEDERNELDRLIIERIQTALQRIEEI